MTDFYLKFLFLLIQFLFIGIAPSLYFKNLFGKRSVYWHGIMSIYLGLTFLNLTLLSLGQIGLPVTGNYLTGVKIILTILSIIHSISFLISRNTISKDMRKSKISISSLKKIIQFKKFDALLMILFLGFYIFLVDTSTRVITSAIDHFSFWLIDAKIINLTGMLRQNAEIIGQFAYSSYYPLHAIYVYDIFGYIAEQYSIFFTIVYLAFATFFTYSLSGKSLAQKILCFALLGLINLTLLQFTFRFYADITISALITFFVYISLQKVSSPQIFLKKFGLILITLFIISLIKSSTSTYSVALLIIYIGYDYKEIKKHIKFQNIKKHIHIVFLYIYLVATLFSRFYYSRYTLIMPNSDGTNNKFIYTAAMKLEDLNPHKSINHLGQLLSLVYEFHRYIYILFFVTLVSIVIIYIIKKDYIRNRKLLFLVLCAYTLPTINILFYAITNKYSSIPRYVTTTFFLIPIIIILIYEKFELRKIKYVFTISSLTLFIYIFLNSSQIDILLKQNKFEHNDGKYTNLVGFKSLEKTSMNVKSIIKDDPLFILFYEENYKKRPGVNIYSNESSEVFLLKYYFVENYQGGTFTLEKDEFIEKIETQKVQYLLLIDSPDFFKATNHDYPVGSKYNLIKLDSYELLDYNIIYSE